MTVYEIYRFIYRFLSILEKLKMSGALTVSSDSLLHSVTGHFGIKPLRYQCRNVDTSALIVSK